MIPMDIVCLGQVDQRLGQVDQASGGVVGGTVRILFVQWRFCKWGRISFPTTNLLFSFVHVFSFFLQSVLAGPVVVCLFSLVNGIDLPGICWVE